MSTQVVPLTSSANSSNEKISTNEEKKAVRMLDYTVLPLVTMFYLLSFLASLPCVQVDSVLIVTLFYRTELI